MPPRKGYFEFDDHPASTIPKTPMLEIANMNEDPDIDVGYHHLRAVDFAPREWRPA